MTHYNALMHGLLFHPRKWPRRFTVFCFALLVGFPETFEFLWNSLFPPQQGHDSAMVQLAMLSSIIGYSSHAHAPLVRRGKGKPSLAIILIGALSYILYRIRGRFLPHPHLYWDIRLGLTVVLLLLLIKTCWASPPDPDLQYPERLSRGHILFNILVGALLVGLIWVMHLAHPYLSIVIIPATHWR